MEGTLFGGPGEGTEGSRGGRLRGRLSREAVFWRAQGRCPANGDPNMECSRVRQTKSARQSMPCAPVGASRCQSVPVGASRCQSVPVGASRCRARQSKPVGAGARQSKPVGAGARQSKPVGAVRCQTVPCGASRCRGAPVGAVPAGDPMMFAFMPSSSMTPPLASEKGNREGHLCDLLSSPAIPSHPRFVPSWCPVCALDTGPCPGSTEGALVAIREGGGRREGHLFI